MQEFNTQALSRLASEKKISMSTSASTMQRLESTSNNNEQPRGQKWEEYLIDKRRYKRELQQKYEKQKNEMENSQFQVSLELVQALSLTQSQIEKKKIKIQCPGDNSVKANKPSKQLNKHVNQDLFNQLMGKSGVYCRLNYHMYFNGFSIDQVLSYIKTKGYDWSLLVQADEITYANSQIMIPLFAQKYSNLIEQFQSYFLSDQLYKKNQTDLCKKLINLLLDSINKISDIYNIIIKTTEMARLYNLIRWKKDFKYFKIGSWLDQWKDMHNRDVKWLHYWFNPRPLSSIKLKSIQQSRKYLEDVRIFLNTFYQKAGKFGYIHIRYNLWTTLIAMKDIGENYYYYLSSFKYPQFCRQYLDILDQTKESPNKKVPILNQLLQQIQTFKKPLNKQLVDIDLYKQHENIQNLNQYFDLQLGAWMNKNFIGQLVENRIHLILHNIQTNQKK